MERKYKEQRGLLWQRVIVLNEFSFQIIRIYSVKGYDG
jgi:hypothetical protein